MEGITVKSFGAYAPSLIVTNDDLSKLVETSDEWIVERTGIKERRISTKEDTSQLAINASKKALLRAELDGNSLDLIIVATVTPDNFCPSVACMVQKEIGAENAMAFDINAACSGFMFATNIAYSMMKSNENIKNALIVGAETLSKVIDWKDRGTCCLFGDGSGAMILSKEDIEKEKKFYFVSKSVGEKYEALKVGAMPLNNPFLINSDVKKQKLEMDGKEVFKFATFSIVNVIKKILEENDLDIEDIDYIVPHQANYRIIQYAAKKLKQDISKFYINLDKYGNTSAASIPIALNDMYEKNMLERGMKIIVVGFGGGLTYAGALIEI